MASYAELAAEPLPQIWQELRALRSQNPANFALLRLSQMGRAIAAASPFLSQKEYSLSGPGLTDGELQGAASQGLASLKIQREAKGAFPALAKALEASSIEEPIPLGDLWDLLPYADRFPLPGPGKLQRLVLDPESADFVRGQETARGRLYPLPVGLQATVTDPTQSRTIVDGKSVAEEYGLLGRFLEGYPTLSGWRTTSTPGQPIPHQRGFNGHEEYLVLPPDLAEVRETDRIISACDPQRQLPRRAVRPSTSRFVGPSRPPLYALAGGPVPSFTLSSVLPKRVGEADIHLKRCPRCAS
jgi:hypothetical protein